MFSILQEQQKIHLKLFSKLSLQRHKKNGVRERELQMLKNLDEDSRSAITKQAEEGFEAGLYVSVNEGVRDYYKQRVWCR